MIEYKKLIYLDVYKTGSSHIIALLDSLLDEKAIRAIRHAPMTSGRPYSWKGGKMVFATVRNPWDWYVSQWSYAGSQKGSLYQSFEAALDKQELDHLFDRQNPREGFARWLRAVNNKEFVERVVGQNMQRSGLAGEIGLYSYRFMRVTTPYPKFFLKRWMLPSIDAALRYQRRFGLYDEVLRAESLDDDLVEFVQKHRERCGFADDAAELVRKAAARPKNRSVKFLPSYRDYYDDELRELVGAKDRLLVDLFGYSF